MSRIQEALLWMAGIVVGTACAAAMLLVLDHVSSFDERRVPLPASVELDDRCRHWMPLDDVQPEAAR